MKNFAMALLALMGMALAGCATSVPFVLQRPPVWNTLGIQRIAVMPFATTNNSPLQRRVASWLTNESLQHIQATNHFTLVSSSEVTRIRASGGNVENIADAIFSGQVLSVSVYDDSRREQRHNRDKTVNHYTLYHRDVRVSFSYSLVRTSDAAIAGSNTVRDITLSDTSEIRESLRPADAMLQELIYGSLADVGRFIAPYTVSERRRLQKETSGDKAVKQRAKDAGALVKAGSYKSAQEAYLGIYRDTGSFAAARNAGLLIEARGDLEGAAAFMQKVYNDTGNPVAAAEIARLRRLMDEAGLLAAYAENQTVPAKIYEGDM